MFFLCFGRHFFLGSLGRSSEVECNPKMNILFFDDLGGLFLFFFCVLVDIFCSDCSANHQKLNIIIKGTFYFLMTYGAFFVFFLCFCQCFLLRLLSRSSEVECNPKMNILFFNDFGGLFHFFAFRSTFFAQITQPIIRS